MDKFPRMDDHLPLHLRIINTASNNIALHPHIDDHVPLPHYYSSNTDLLYNFSPKFLINSIFIFSEIASIATVINKFLPQDFNAKDGAIGEQIAQLKFILGDYGPSIIVFNYFILNSIQLCIASISCPLWFYHLNISDLLGPP